MDCHLPSSSVHGISQARMLRWVAIPSCRGSSWPRDRTCLLQCRRILYCWTTSEAQASEVKITESHPKSFKADLGLLELLAFSLWFRCWSPPIFPIPALLPGNFSWAVRWSNHSITSFLSLLLCVIVLCYQTSNCLFYIYIYIYIYIKHHCFIYFIRFMFASGGNINLVPFTLFWLAVEVLIL